MSITIKYEEYERLHAEIDRLRAEKEKLCEILQCYNNDPASAYTTLGAIRPIPTKTAKEGE